MAKQSRPRARPYTIRGVPPEVGAALRRKAQQRQQSLNRVVLDELTRAVMGRPIKARFLARETVVVLYADRETTEQYARLFVQLKRAGTPAPDNDVWIAALCLEHDLALITRDKHFDKIPQLRQTASR